jgi:hypothetical protein
VGAPAPRVLDPLVAPDPGLQQRLRSEMQTRLAVEAGLRG